MPAMARIIEATRAAQPGSARGGCSVTVAGVSASEILPLGCSGLMATLVEVDAEAIEMISLRYGSRDAHCCPWRGRVRQAPRTRGRPPQQAFRGTDRL